MMNVLDVAIVLFIILELANVLIIYFKPDFKYGNAVSVFKHWGNSQSDEKSRLFSKYMANWVANSKAIFVVLLFIILLFADDTTKFWVSIALIPSISLYYVSLHPIMKKLDAMDEIVPKGYSKVLLAMITSFIILFTVAIVVYACNNTVL